MAKNLYFFNEGDGSNKKLLGGKGAGLCTMAQLGLPVPPGFVITTEVCRRYYESGGKLPDELMSEVGAAMQKLEKLTGKHFGDPNNPLLVSIRSGSMLSMPGMMDTILNLGLNDESVEGLAKGTKNERFAYDAYRRFIQMFGKIVLGVDGKKFEEAFDEHKHKVGAKLDTDLKAEDLKEIVRQFKQIIKEEKGEEFPNDPHEQLRGAISAVFKSWNTKRAKEYREFYKIPHDLYTAVNVVTMVFGNMGPDSGTGVAFTRDPATGEKALFGEFLFNAQGEDVVAGVRTPLKIAELEEKSPHLYQQLLDIAGKLEQHYREMQDVEFTVEQGRFYMLQTRAGKRTAQAAVKIAVDMAEEGLITRDEAILRVDPKQIEQMLHKQVDPKAKGQVIAKGLNASPGAAVGKVVFDSERAKEMGEKKEKVILVRPETSPDDVGGIIASQGVLTSRGGMTCVAGETKILTERGFLSAREAYDRLAHGEALHILAFDHRFGRSIWRRIIAAGRRSADVCTIAVSQTGRAQRNTLRLTPDHKMFTVQNRQFLKKRLKDCLDNGDFLCIPIHIPALNQVQLNETALAYSAGAIFTDGYINLKQNKGSVTFCQKNVSEKQHFIEAVHTNFADAFGTPFTYARQRETESTLRGRTIGGNVQDSICFHRKPAQVLTDIWNNIVPWVLSLDRDSLFQFLAGVLDGDGTFNPGSNRVNLFVSKEPLLQGIVVALLRLGIVPHVTNNRNIYNVQISAKFAEILKRARRVKGEERRRLYDHRLFSARSLFSDVVDQVNYMGRAREGIKRNILVGASKIERDLLPLCPPSVKNEVQVLLDSDLCMYRVREVGESKLVVVYNFEVDAEDELDKNFVVFTEQYTPVLISNSHAAVVTRGMGKPAVVGCESIKIDPNKRSFEVNGVTVKEGDTITINGSNGEVLLGEAPLIEPQMSVEFEKLLFLADEFKRLQNWANADYPQDAKRARELGAQGIGLCRTEHMFFEEKRLPLVHQMILAETEEERKGALEKLLEIQKGDFKGILKEMNSLPVVIRLLDPPLHEFLPKYEELLEEVIMRRMSREKPAELEVAEKLLKRVEAMREANPMMGLRGCRLGITRPDINEMQVRAIFEAACELKQEGRDPKPEIMIPLVGHVNELKVVREQLERVAREVMSKHGVDVSYKFGTMIEVPRAALTADEIAEFAEFFSFGTNDLTQMTYAYSRDDAEGKFMFKYIEQGILDADPFQTLDRKGVGKLMRIGVELGRGRRSELEIGICGEHGGDPESIKFCHELGLNYVSCSPFRIPVARIAAAHAALRAGEAEKQRYL